jgi:hypothetical protein
MPVLIISIGRLIFALEFDPDSEIITAGAPAKTGLSSVPGAPAEWNKLS